MKVSVYDLQGKPTEKIELPKVFQELIREDLIIRAVLASLSKNRKPYGVDVMAGKRTSAHYHGSRKYRWTMMNRAMARVPRIHGKVSPHMMWRVRFVPQAVKGRKAHPPIVLKVWDQKINKKERKKAIWSAIAASAVKDLVVGRGHRIEKLKEFPLVVDDKIQTIGRTKELIGFFEKIGLEEELKRIKERKMRAGRGKMRGRKYRRKIGPLIVVTNDGGVGKAARNLPGINVCRVENLSADYLAPGTVPGRLVVWTKSAIERLGA